MYEAITIMAKKSKTKWLSEIKRIDWEMEEFATYNDSLEVFLKTKNKLRFQNFMKNYLSHML
jgi:hypothetical protein